MKGKLEFFVLFLQLFCLTLIKIKTNMQNSEYNMPLSGMDLGKG